MLNKSLIVASFITSLWLAGAALASEHGYVSSIQHHQLDEKLFSVNIETINGEDPSPGPNHRADAGKNVVKVGLSYDTSWGRNLAATLDYVYMKEIEVEVEAGKHYFIAAKVDTDASPEDVKANTFWEPVIAEVKD